MIKLTIIIPVYNQEVLIKRAMDSIPKRDDIEVIIINDGSTDNTLKSIEEQLSIYNKNFSVVSYEENKGVAHALNKGLDYARGEYIVALGSDDYFYTKNFDTFMQTLDGTDMVYFVLERNNGTLIIPNESNRNLWVGSTKAYKRSFIGDTRYPDGKRAAEDLVFDIEVRKKEHTYKFTDILLKHYNFPREGSLTQLANKGLIKKEFIG